MKKIIYPVLVAFLFAGCGPNAHIEQSWRDPDVTVDMAKLNKVLIVALLKNEAMRRSVEDELVNMMKGKGVASYNYLTKDVNQAMEGQMTERLKKEGFDGALVMRLVNVDKDVRYVPGTFPPYYMGFWRYYWYSWANFYQPGYYETIKTYTVETNVYSLTRDKLIWSGVTTSVNPDNVAKLMKAVAKVVFKQMKKEGFIVNA